VTAPDPTDHQIHVKDVAARLESGQEFHLVDIRGPEFRDVARIEGDVEATEELMEKLLQKPKETEIVFYCHKGISSLDVTAYFLEQGFTNVKSMIGGIAAWSQEIDPSVPRY